MSFQTKNNENPWISHPTAHNNCHPIPTSQFAEPFLPESRSREIHPGFTMAQRRSGTSTMTHLARGLETSGASTTQVEAKTLIFPSFLGLGVRPTDKQAENVATMTV